MCCKLLPGSAGGSLKGWSCCRGGGGGGGGTRTSGPPVDDDGERDTTWWMGSPAAVLRWRRRDCCVSVKRTGNLVHLRRRSTHRENTWSRCCGCSVRLRSAHHIHQQRTQCLCSQFHRKAYMALLFYLSASRGMCLRGALLLSKSNTLVHHSATYCDYYYDT